MWGLSDRSVVHHSADRNSQEHTRRSSSKFSSKLRPCDAKDPRASSQTLQTSMSMLVSESMSTESVYCVKFKAGKTSTSEFTRTRRRENSVPWMGSGSLSQQGGLTSGVFSAGFVHIKALVKSSISCLLNYFCVSLYVFFYLTTRMSPQWGFMTFRTGGGWTLSPPPLSRSSKRTLPCEMDQPSLSKSESLMPCTDAAFTPGVTRLHKL